MLTILFNQGWVYPIGNASQDAYRRSDLIRRARKDRLQRESLRDDEEMLEMISLSIELL